MRKCITCSGTGFLLAEQFSVSDMNKTFEERLVIAESLGIEICPCCGHQDIPGEHEDSEITDCLFD
jgi:hypothetical protein